MRKKLVLVLSLLLIAIVSFAPLASADDLDEIRGCWRVENCHERCLSPV